MDGRLTDYARKVLDDSTCWVEFTRADGYMLVRVMSSNRLSWTSLGATARDAKASLRTEADMSGVPR